MPGRFHGDPADRLLIVQFQFEECLAQLDRIRTLDFGSQGNMGARGLMIGYTSPDPYVVWTLLPGLTEAETMRVIEILRPELPREIRSALVCGALYAHRSMLNNEAYVLRPGAPLPIGFKPRCGLALH